MSIVEIQDIVQGVWFKNITLTCSHLMIIEYVLILKFDAWVYL